MPKVSIPALMLILLVVAMFLFFAPLNPSITVTFRLEPNPNPNDAPIVTVEAWNYAKLSITSSANVPKGTVLLIGYAGQPVPEYSVLVRIAYGQRNLTQDGIVFTVGPGSYQMRVVYSPMAEQTNIPYSITISAAAPGNQTFVGTFVNVFPVA
jgi:hypothetical protein